MPAHGSSSRPCRALGRAGLRLRRQLDREAIRGPHTPGRDRRSAGPKGRPTPDDPLLRCGPYGSLIASKSLPSVCHGQRTRSAQTCDSPAIAGPSTYGSDGTRTRDLRRDRSQQSSTRDDRMAPLERRRPSDCGNKRCAPPEARPLLAISVLPPRMQIRRLLTSIRPRA